MLQQRKNETLTDSQQFNRLDVVLKVCYQKITKTTVQETKLLVFGLAFLCIEVMVSKASKVSTLSVVLGNVTRKQNANNKMWVWENMEISDVPYRK